MRTRTTMVAAITLATLVVVGLLSVMSIQGSYASQLTTEQSKLASTAQVTAELISQQMTGVEEVEETTLEQPAFIAAVGSGDPTPVGLQQLQTVLNGVQALRPEYQFASVADAKGIARATAPPDPAGIGTDRSFRNWFQGVRRTGSAYVSTGYTSAVPGAPLVVAVAAPIRAATPAGSMGGEPGRVVGVLFIGYKLGSLQAFADRLADLQQIDLQVTDQAGMILARTGGTTRQLAAAERTPALRAALAGRATSSASGTTIDAATPVGGIAWTVSATAPLRDTLAMSDRRTATFIAAGLLLVLCIAGGATIVVTRRMEHAQFAHAASAAELRTVLETLTEAIQVFDADGNLTSRNPAADATYELAPSEVTTASVTPKWELLREDGTTMEIDDGPLARCMQTGETSQRVVVGIRRRFDGLVRWLSISTVPIRDRRAQVFGYVSCARDISEGVETTRSLLVLTAAAARLSSTRMPAQVIEALSAAASDLSSSRGEPPRHAVVLMVDAAAALATSSELDAVTPAQNIESIPVTHHPFVQTVLASRTPLVAEFSSEDFGPVLADLTNEGDVRNGALIPLIRDRRVFAIIVVAGLQHQMIRDAQIEHLKTLATFGALAFSNAYAHERAEARARTDPLTHLGNRRALADRFAQLGRQRFAVVAIDVDDLKTVNDAYGHDAGDLLLAGLAAAMNKELRPSDILVRTGGDEFVALLVDCDAHGAAQLCKRLDRAVQQVMFPWGTRTISLGAAAGAAGDEPTAVASAADRALYEAKQATQAGRSVPHEVPVA